MLTIAQSQELSRLAGLWAPWRYSDTGKLWVGSQRYKRLRLCAFIADQIELDMKEVQNESQQ